MTEPRPAPPHPARQIIIDLVVMTIIGIVLALIGPFGSFSAPFSMRLVYWLGLAWAGYACYRPIGGVISRLGPRLDLPDWSLWLVACLIATMPMTGVVWLVSALPLPLEIPSLEALLATYGYVLAIGMVVTMVFYLVQANPGASPQAAPLAVISPPAETAPAAPPASRPPRLLARLPLALGTDLIALEMEDHYLRVHTILGSDLILLRMRDAVAELDGLDGAQVHRSWWVSRAAVGLIERDGRNIRLTLPRGLSAPVARNMVPALKSAGWL